MSAKYAFASTLKEVRFLFCQTGEGSGATRFVLPQLKMRWGIGKGSFLARAYPTMKKNNPQTPIMLREAQGTKPVVWARY
ncbi:NADH-ubiquinone oxidoreductase 10.5 kDa subunit, partial [Lachnellula suecica]